MTPAPTTISFFGGDGEAQRAGRGDDRLLVDLDARQPRDVRAGGDDDRLGFERGLLAVGALDDHAPGAAMRPSPLTQSILFFLNR